MECTAAPASGASPRRWLQSRESTVNEVRVGAARLTASQDPAPVDLAIAALAKAGFTAHLEA